MRSLRPQLAVSVALRRALTMAAAGLSPTLAGCTGLAACLALVACSRPAAEVQLPARPTVTPSIATSPAVLTPRQQVVSALTGYTTALDAADRSRSKPAARELLRPYLAASRIGGLVRAISAIWARGERFYGVDVLHISGVRINGRHAFVHDCDDTSGMGLSDSVTGQTVPGSAGAARDNVLTRLDLVRGHWLVAFQLVEDVPCTR
jgi:hypothetical protein